MKFLRVALLLLLLSPCSRVFSQITCDFTLADSSGCAPFVILATAVNTSPFPVTQRIWYVTGPGPANCNFTSPSGLNPTLSFAVTCAGNYCIRLWSRNSNGDTCSITKCLVTVGAKPTVNFSFTPPLLEGCQPFCITYQNNSTPGTGVIDSVQVDEGCGTASYFPPLTFPHTKCYVACPVGCVDISVTVFNSFGCFEDTVYDCIVNIIQPPTAFFVADTAVANCASGPLTVNFLANSNTTPNLQYCWYIDGVQQQCGTSLSYQHTFPINNSNCYDIMLIVSHPSGCSDTFIRSDFVCVRTIPQISYTQTATSICVNTQEAETVCFANTTPGLTNLTWTLNGPGGPYGPITDDSVCFTLTTAGNYTMTASGSFGPGCSNSLTQQVIVASAKPVAAFTVTDTFSCKAPFTVTFTATPCTNCAYTWLFNSGIPSASGNPVQSVTYPGFGNKDVRLIVTDTTTGCSDTLLKDNYIHISKLSPKITFNKSKACAPLCPTFSDITNYSLIPPSNPIASACWSFPGSAIPGSCLSTFTQCFNTPGCYDVVFKITTTTGCVDSVHLVDTICAGTPPQFTMTATPTSMCFEADTVLFTLTGVNGDSLDFVKAIWGDGSPDEIFYTTVFEHIYQDTGCMNTQIITFRDSCVGDTLTQQICIFPPITIFHDSSGCLTGDTVFFINESKGATSYVWNFCDGTTSNQANPYKVFPPCDTCTVTLTTFNSSSGCSHFKTVDILTACTGASFTPTDTVLCAGRNAIFCNTSPSQTPSFTQWDFFVPPVNWAGAFSTCRTQFFGFTGVYPIAMRNRGAGANGCIDTAYGTVTVCRVQADFTSNSVCFPAPYCFFDASRDTFCGVTGWSWDFGDGSPLDSTQNPCHVYATPGSYQVSLTAWNSTGCPSTVTYPIIVSAPVTLSYTKDTVMCPGSAQCIANSSTGPALNFTWTIPTANYINGTNAQSFNPCFTMPTVGDYMAYVNVTSNNICSVEDSFMIHVGYPIAQGYVDVDTINCPEPPIILNYTSTSIFADGGVTWDFGDSSGSSIPVSTNIYTVPGTYYVTLIARSNDGCSDTSAIDTILVRGPYGDFSFSPTPGICACQDSIDFVVNTYNASKFTLIYGCNAGFTTVDPIVPIGTVANPTINTLRVPFCIACAATPQLIFADASGCEVLLEKPTPLYIDSPVVNFTFNNYGVCVNGTVCFSDATTYALPDSVSYTIHREWTFGDGSGVVDTTANPCHYYAQPGGYQTILRVWSNLGCVDSITSVVVVVPEFPIAAYTQDDTLICANSPTCFHDSSWIYPLTAADYWVWDFGDGNTDTTNSPDICHTYTVGGTYRVTMCVYDSVGCPDCDSSKVITVVSNPIADAGGDQFVCYGYATQLQGSGSTNCYWSPPALVSNPNICNPTINITFDTSIVLIVSDSYGCSDTDTVALSTAQVFAGFTVGSSFCTDDNVCITDQSTNSNGTLTTWSYDYGDLTAPVSGSNPNPCRYYASSGTFTILQTVTDDHGCFDTATQSVLIHTSPIAAFSLNDSVICASEQICITDLSVGTATPINAWQWSYGPNQATSSLPAPGCYTFNPPYNPDYNVELVITDQNGCHDTAQILVTVNENPTANFSWSTSCEDEVMPLASTSIPGDAIINTCEWLLWVGAPVPTIDNNCNTSFDFDPGYHDVQLVVTDLNGCVDTVVKTVFTDSLSQLSISPGDTTICLGNSIDYTVSGIFDNITWTPNVWISDPTSPTVTVDPLASITYVVSAANGVCSSANDTFTVRVVQPIPVEVDATPDQIVLGLSSNLTSQYPGMIDSIIWSPSETLDCRDCPNPIAMPSVTTTYTATIYYGQNGITCDNSASVTIEVLNNCAGSIIYVPNTFTPNADGLNDVFMIRGLAATRINYFRVFDRWGKLVFETTNGEPNEPRWGWDGNDRSGQKLNPAVFVYTYEIECINHETVSGSGNVTLVR